MGTLPRLRPQDCHTEPPGPGLENSPGGGKILDSLPADATGRPETAGLQDLLWLEGSIRPTRRYLGGFDLNFVFVSWLCQVSVFLTCQIWFSWHYQASRWPVHESFLGSRLVLGCQMRPGCRVLHLIDFFSSQTHELFRRQCCSITFLLGSEGRYLTGNPCM